MFFNLKTDYSWVSFQNSLIFLSFILSLALYPYVYFATTTALQLENKDQLEAADSFGATEWKKFTEITLPHLKPFLISSMIIVSLETISDFGTSYIYGINTLTTSIHKIWVSFFSFETASQFSNIIILLVMLLYLKKKQDE